MAVAEDNIMICIDNSRFINRLGYRIYNFQLDCVRSYSRAKLECNNPKTSIGMVTMGTADKTNLCWPTTKLEQILDHLRCNFLLGGDLNFKYGIMSSMLSVPRVAPHSKRLIFFTAGHINLNIEEAEEHGMLLKRLGVAVDVVNFFVKDYYKVSKKALNTFVAAADSNNNSHIVHIEAKLLTHWSDIVSRAPEIFSSSLVEEGEKAKRFRMCKATPKRKNKVEEAADAHVA